MVNGSSGICGLSWRAQRPVLSRSVLKQTAFQTRPASVHRPVVTGCTMSDMVLYLNIWGDIKGRTLRGVHAAERRVWKA